MDELEINQKLKNVKQYLGTFALDELNEIKIHNLPVFFIVNLDRRQYGHGNHWIGIGVYLKTLFICDSLGGLQPDDSFPTELVTFLNHMLRKRKLEMTKQLQPLESDTCGFYCVTFVKEMAKSNNFNDFLSLFTDNYSNNDLVIKFLNKR